MAWKFWLVKSSGWRTNRPAPNILEFHCHGGSAWSLLLRQGHSDSNADLLRSRKSYLPYFAFCLFGSGNLYNIPIRIWIHETHPHSPPKCCVWPSAFMVINTKSSFVDAGGHIHLHCLNNWKIVSSRISISPTHLLFSNLCVLETRCEWCP